MKTKGNRQGDSCGVKLHESENVDSSLDELEELVNTAGAEACGRAIQARDSIHPGTYVEKARLRKLRI